MIRMTHWRKSHLRLVQNSPPLKREQFWFQIEDERYDHWIVGFVLGFMVGGILIFGVMV